MPQARGRHFPSYPNVRVVVHIYSRYQFLHSQTDFGCPQQVVRGFFPGLSFLPPEVLHVTSSFSSRTRNNPPHKRATPRNDSKTRKTINYTTPHIWRLLPWHCNFCSRLYVPQPVSEHDWSRRVVRNLYDIVVAFDPVYSTFGRTP